jgi:hypothetical protein
MMALPQTGGAIIPFAAIMTQAHPGLVAAALAQPPAGVATSLVVHASKLL